MALKDEVNELKLQVEALTKERNELLAKLGPAPKPEPDQLVRTRKREHQSILRGGKP